MMFVEEGNSLLSNDLKAPKSSSLIDNCIDNSRSGLSLTLALCLAMGNAADAVEIMCIGFIMTDMGDISSTNKELLSSAVFMGMLVGGLICGYLSDIIGRKPCLLFSLGLNSVAGLCSSIVPDISWLIVCRVIGGLGIGGSVPVVFSLGAEIFPSAVRGKYLSVIASFWMVGAVFTAFSAWIMLGSDYEGNKILPHVGWRPFAAVSALPAIIALILTYFKVPESPRYLVDKGRFAEAAEVLRYLSILQFDTADLDPRVSEGDDVDGLRIVNSSSNIGEGRQVTAVVDDNRLVFNRLRGDDLSDQQQEQGEREGDYNRMEDKEGKDTPYSPSSFSNKTRSIPSRIFLSLNSAYSVDLRKPPSTLRILFGAQLRKTTLVLMLIWFTLCFGTYGLSTWISTLFSDVGLSNPYADAFIFALANLPGNAVSILYVERLGRKKLLAYGMCLAGVSVIGFALDTHDAVVVVLSASLFNALSVVGWNSLDCLSVECFPTSVRTSAMGVLAATGRLGAVAAQFVNGSLEKNIPVLLFVTCGCTIFGGLVSFLLPDDHTGTALPESAVDSLEDDIVNSARNGSRSR